MQKEDGNVKVFSLSDEEKFISENNFWKNALQKIKSGWEHYGKWNISHWNQKSLNFRESPKNIPWNSNSMKIVNFLMCFQ